MQINVQNNNHQTVANIQHVQVHGQPGVGSYTLLMRLTFQPVAIKIQTILRNLRIRIGLPDSARPIIAWGEKDDQGPITFTEYSNSNDAFFYVSLSTSLLNALEQIRGGGDLNLQIILTGTTIQGASAQDFAQMGNYVIPQQQWVTALGEMNFMRSLLYEIKFKGNLTNKPSSAESLLHNAIQHFSKGHYTESVGYCRKIIEYLEKNEANKEKAINTVSKYKSAREDMTLEERILFLREALKNATQLSVHHTEDGEFSRKQANAILGITIALIGDSEIVDVS
jgi:hypothetical protein